VVVERLKISTVFSQVAPLKLERFHNWISAVVRLVGFGPRLPAPRAARARRHFQKKRTLPLLCHIRMNVHFIRHGAAISNDPRLTEADIAEERFLDAPLNDHGRKQALLAGEELARALHEATVDVVLVSPLCRALETAELILSSAGISPPVRVIELLREAHGVRRCDARRPRSVAAARFPSFDFSAVETEDDTWHQPTVRESVQELHGRCQRFEAMLRSLPSRA
jgi:broad specificity phosphatase PhoE